MERGRLAPVGQHDARPVVDGAQEFAYVAEAVSGAAEQRRSRANLHLGVVRNRGDREFVSFSRLSLRLQRRAGTGTCALSHAVDGTVVKAQSRDGEGDLGLRLEGRMRF